VDAFVDEHLFQNGTAARVVSWQLFQMLLKMRADLLFGFRHEAQTPLVARQTRRSADAEGQGIPGWVEQAGSTVEFLQTLLAPYHMIDFLSGRMLHGVANVWQSSSQGLALIKCLGAHFTRVIDAHHSCHIATLRFRQDCIVQILCRRRPLGGTCSRHQRTQCLVELLNQLIDVEFSTMRGVSHVPSLWRDRRCRA